MPILMPKDTRNALGSGAQKCESRSLLQQKFVFFDANVKDYKRVALDLFLTNGVKDLEFLRNEQSRAKQKAENKNNTNTKNYRDTCSFLEATKEFAGGRKIELFPYESIWINKIPSSRKVEFSLRTAERLIIGQSDGVLENCGMKLHRNFGIPYLPGSALKGIARDAASELPEFKIIFGNNPEEKKEIYQGAVGFLPAFPIDKNARLELDISTPHYKAYYGHEKNPDGREKNPKALDNENPVPNVFPVIAKGVQFKFTLLCLDKRFSEIEAQKYLVLAAKALQTALIENGVGAKTASGYGRFEEVTAVAPINIENQPSESSEDKLISKWKGKVSSGNFAMILNDLANIAESVSLKRVFNAIMPEAELKPQKFNKKNSFWQSFSSRPQGKMILEKLNLKLG